MYVAAPDSGRGPAVIVIQEWWGIDAHMKSVVDRFAAEGFLAVAPDLYHGEVTSSPDEAGRLLMELDIDRAEKEIAAAATHLLSRPECSSKTVGVVGFCMGGALAQHAATRDPNISAAVSFYGGFRKATPQWENLRAPLILIYAGRDKGVPVEAGRELEQKLKSMNKNVELVVYPDAEHGFFNDTKPRYDAAAAADAWRRTIEHFRKYVR